MAKRKKKPVLSAKFKVGDKVLVKHGVKDVDYPDMPLGGWAGTVIPDFPDDSPVIGTQFAPDP